MHWARTATVWLISLYVCQANGAYCACSPLSAPERELLLQVIRAKFLIEPDVSLRLLSDEPSNNECFRELGIEGRGPIGTWSLKLFLSPDHRFISSDLYPVSLGSGSLQDDKYVPKNGSDAALVTVTVFADFQSSTSKRVADVMKILMRRYQPNELRLEFRNLPMRVDAWAFKAAQGAACAEIQSDTAFWSIHDRLFAEQQSITSANATDKLLTYAAETKSLNKAEFETCVKREGSLGLVLRDIDQAAARAVRSAPAVLIDGTAVSDPTDEQGLQIRIEQAINNANAIRRSPAVDRKP